MSDCWVVQSEHFGFRKKVQGCLPKGLQPFAPTPAVSKVPVAPRRPRQRLVSSALCHSSRRVVGPHSLC